MDVEFSLPTVIMLIRSLLQNLFSGRVFRPALFYPSASIQSDGRADQRLERLRVNLLTLVNVDRAPYLSVKARVEELGRIFQGCALEERKLDYRLVRLSGTDAAVMGPYRGSHPLPLFHNIRVGVP